MRLSSRGRYAVTAMLDIALHYNDGPVSLADISKRQGISVAYLEQLTGRLRKQGLVKSVRGPGGGYRLSMQAEEIAVSDIIAAVDENVDVTRCGGSADCQDHQRCLTHELWEGLNQQIYEFLSTISLADAMQQGRVTEVAARQDQMFRNEFEVEFRT